MSCPVSVVQVVLILQGRRLLSQRSPDEAVRLGVQ